MALTCLDVYANNDKRIVGSYRVVVVHIPCGTVPRLHNLDK